MFVEPTCVLARNNGVLNTMHFCSAAKFLGAVFLDLITDGEARLLYGLSGCAAERVA